MSPSRSALFAARHTLVEALLPSTVAAGFSPEVARAGLEAELASWTEAALATLVAELPADWEARAPKTALVIAARTLPVSALRQVLFARELGARVLLKCAAGQEALGEAIASVDAGVVPTPFSSTDDAAIDRAIADADAVIALGSDETIAALRLKVPADKAFAPHGHKVSAAWLATPSDDEVLALAEDLVAWDQAGCLAPQVAWVEGGPAAIASLAERLARVLPAIEARLPLADASAHRALRQRVVARVAMLGGNVVGTPTAALISARDTAFRPSPGPRMLWLLPADLGALLAVQPILSTLAVPDRTGHDWDVPPAHVRVCTYGHMQRPPLDWHQDGLHPLASLLRP